MAKLRGMQRYSRELHRFLLTERVPDSWSARQTANAGRLSGQSRAPQYFIGD